MFVVAFYVITCNPVRLSLESIKGNLLTYSFTYLPNVCSKMILQNNNTTSYSNEF